MKKAIVIGILAGSTSVANAADFWVDFDILGGIAVNNYSSLEIDIEFTGRYISAHGALLTTDGMASPATGTCFETSSGGVFCNLQVDQSSFTVTIGSNLSGTISEKNGNGIQTDSAPLVFVSLE